LHYNQLFLPFEHGNLGKIIEESSEKCIILMFTAKWLGSGYLLERYLRQEGSAYPELKYYKVDVDDNQALVEKMNIKLIPTIYVFVNGEIVAYLEGLVSRGKVKAMFEQAMDV
jgi:thioredoxin 1